MTITDTTIDPNAYVNDARPVSVFASLQDQVWRFRYEVELHVQHLVGGTPLHRDVVASWIKARIGTKDLQDLELVRMVEETIEGRQGTDPLSVPDAIGEVAAKTNLNGFYRRNGALVFPGRNIKAAMKEGISVAIAGGHLPRDRGWGKTNKGLLSWAAEHVYIPAEFVAILDTDGNLLTDPTGIQQRQVSTHQGTSIVREEYVRPALLRFEVLCDDDAIDKAWAQIFTMSQSQGIGATRSQGYGQYVVTGFTKTVLSEGLPKPKD